MISHLSLKPSCWAGRADVSVSIAAEAFSPVAASPARSIVFALEIVFFSERQNQRQRDRDKGKERERKGQKAVGEGERAGDRRLCSAASNLSGQPQVWRVSKMIVAGARPAPALWSPLG